MTASLRWAVAVHILGGYHVSNDQFAGTTPIPPAGEAADVSHRRRRVLAPRFAGRTPHEVILDRREESRLPLPGKSDKIGMVERGVPCLRCPRCQEEVAFARVCPYCGQQMPSPPSADGPQRKRSTHQEEPRGRFRGVIDDPSRTRGSSPAERIPIWFLLPRYLLDKSVPLTRKLLLLLGILYIVIPFDITPDFIPLLGWLDDIGVGTFLWYYLKSELMNYRQRL